MNTNKDENRDGLDEENELKRLKNLEEWERNNNPWDSPHDTNREENEEFDREEDDKEAESYRRAGFLTYFALGDDEKKIVGIFAFFRIFYLLIRFIIYDFQKLFRMKVDEDNLPDFWLLKKVGLFLFFILLVYFVAWFIVRLSG